MHSVQRVFTRLSPPPPKTRLAYSQLFRLNKRRESRAAVSIVRESRQSKQLYSLKSFRSECKQNGNTAKRLNRHRSFRVATVA